MKLHHFLILSVAVLLSVGTLCSQPRNRAKPTTGERTERMVQRMTRQLDLNEKQSKKVYSVVLSFYQEREKALKKSDSQRLDSTVRKHLWANMNQSLNKILTAEQYKKWEQYQLQMRNHEGRGKGKGRASEPK